MATLTVSIDPELLEAARHAADLRHTTLDDIITDYLAEFADARRSDPSLEEGLRPLLHGDQSPFPESKHSATPDESHKRRVLDLLEKGLVRLNQAPYTREEIYSERSWPRS